MIGDASSPIETVLRNKKLVQQFWIEVLNGGDYDLIAKMLAPDYTYNGHPSPVEGTAKWLEGLRSAAPDTYFRIEGLIGAHDSVAVRWTVTSTVDGKETMLAGENILTFNDAGQCVSNWQSMGTPDFAHVVSS